MKKKVKFKNKGRNHQHEITLFEVDGSRMNREIHVRFWESAGVRFPCATQQCKARLNPDPVDFIHTEKRV